MKSKRTKNLKYIRPNGTLSEDFTFLRKGREKEKELDYRDKTTKETMDISLF